MIINEAVLSHGKAGHTMAIQKPAKPIHTDAPNISKKYPQIFRRRSHSQKRPGQINNLEILCPGYWCRGGVIIKKQKKLQLHYFSTADWNCVNYLQISVLVLVFRHKNTHQSQAQPLGQPWGRSSPDEGSCTSADNTTGTSSRDVYDGSWWSRFFRPEWTHHLLWRLWPQIQALAKTIQRGV